MLHLESSPSGVKQPEGSRSEEYSVITGRKRTTIPVRKEVTVIEWPIGRRYAERVPLPCTSNGGVVTLLAGQRYSAEKCGVSDPQLDNQQ